MKLSDFDFNLPDDLIAQTPARPRDAARMLVVGASGFSDRIVTDLPSLLRPGDRLVVNDTRVIPARLIGKRGEAKAEATLIKNIGDGRWRAFARPGRRLRIGDRLDFGPNFSCILTEKLDGGEVELAFDRKGADLVEALHQYGAPPLPPYIKRPDGAQPEDVSDYQTPFAEKDGAVAAPTASLHFTESLLEGITDIGVSMTRVTLHVGAGTFLPVKTEDVADHKMHSEWGEVSAVAAAEIEATKQAGGRIIAVGTT
ncbi:MAG: S-adenosylmethionine:tRNA ribosyltransferase-isomerase, partial [Alphaproteobacteria bacterium]